MVLEAALTNERFTDIVDAAALPKSTVHRILATLVEEGFVAGDADSGYRAGGRLLTLAGRVLSDVESTTLALPIAERLAAAVDCTVHIGVLSGDEMVYLIRIDSSKPYRMRSRVGLGIPLHTSGMGKAVMAQWDRADVERYAERTGLPARTEATIADLSALMAQLADVRDRGYALDLGENEAGTVCVAAPVFDHTGRATHGLSISSIALEHPGSSIEALAPEAIAAARELSRLLGASAV
ncbi:IclR family transcriptional regulator [Agromyces agglutinans]|uniref:IclR family transcriptional regulator n=1 Tax=Agromyces agglutinans TaxID=2662258 RepID=UPI0015629833|nr:IclR family transcriptional regulator [Agromyces agglutinans]